MTAKIKELTKRIKTKKETLAKEIEARDKKIEAIKKLESDLKLLEAELVTAHLVANNMTLEDLAALLGTEDKGDSHVSGD